MDLSIVIPAYNEANRLPPTLTRIREYLEANHENWEIVVADDGSTDGTVDKLQPAFPEVRFLAAARNCGKGCAVRRGVLEARGNLILFTDADLSTPIEELGNLMRAIERDRLDGAIASRGLPASRLELRQPRHREWAGRLFNLTVRLVSGLPYRDTQCGFKLFRRSAAREIFSRAQSDGWAFDVEVLMIAKMLDLKIAEVPVRWINSEDSRVKFFVDGPRMLIDILRFRWRRLRGRYGAKERSA